MPPMRTLALVGFGRWGKNLARNFHELDALKGIYDETPFEVPFEGVETLKFFLEPSISQVAIATPASTHFALAKKALLAGKDVFVEKPLCLNSWEAKELIAIAEEKRRILMCGHLLSYHPAFLKLQELLSFLGPLKSLSSSRLNFSPLREEGVHWDLAPHDLTLLLGLVKSPCSHISMHAVSTLNPSIIDTARFDLEFEEGVKGHIHVSWVHPFKETRLVVVGERGMALFDDAKPWEEKLSLSSTKSLILEPIPLAPAEPLKVECAHFLHCCKTREVPRTDGKHALAVIEALERAEHHALSPL